MPLFRSADVAITSSSIESCPHQIQVTPSASICDFNRGDECASRESLWGAERSTNSDAEVLAKLPVLAHRGTALETTRPDLENPGGGCGSNEGPRGLGAAGPLVGRCTIRAIV